MNPKTEARKSREFWIHKGSSDFCSELEYDHELDTYVKARPDGFYDIVSLKDTVDGGIHVREILPNEQSEIEKLRHEMGTLKIDLEYERKLRIRVEEDFIKLCTSVAAMRAQDGVKE
jgi:hypothetical protein